MAAEDRREIKRPADKPPHGPALTFALLAVIVVLAWVYLLFGAHTGMEATDMAVLAMPAEWSLRHFAITLLMWAVMMVAMMLPSGLKVMLRVANLVRGLPSLLAAQHIGEFGAGYLIVWLAFGLVATIAQWGLDGAGLLSATIATNDPTLTGTILLFTGVYEGTPLKQACLDHCRAPEEFLARHSPNGALNTGLRHGLFCLGCCWMLMTLLFALGVMNLGWITAIALVVLCEKILPHGRWAGYASAVVLVGWGAVTVVAPDQSAAGSAIFSTWTLLTEFAWNLAWRVIARGA